MAQQIVDIINSCLKNKTGAKRQLYEMHKVQWFMVCQRYSNSREDARDMLQDGLVQIFKDLHQFDAKRANFSTWSNRVMANAAIRYLKKWKHLNFIEELKDMEQVIIDTSENVEIFNAEVLTKAIQQLPAGYRLVFNMYVLEGYSHQEIANKLNISVGTSRSQFFKAKKQLKAWLEVML